MSYVRLMREVSRLCRTNCVLYTPAVVKETVCKRLTLLTETQTARAGGVREGSENKA